MSWVVLAESHILARMTQSEVDAYQDAGESPSRDRLTGILAQVTALVRGKVASNSENLAKLGTAGTIPTAALWAAATIGRDSLVNSLPVSVADTEGRKEESRQANRILDDIAAGKLRIEDPAGTVPEASDGGAGVYGGNSLLDF